MNRIGLTVAVVVTLLTGSAWGQSSRSGASRVDFDDQLVQGQVNKGAVHLIERKDSDLGSLVKKRTSYRKEILAGTDVNATKPAAAVAALPRQLPVVKAAELKGEAMEIPETKPAAAPAKAAPAAKSSAKKAPAAKSKVPAKVDTKQSKSNKNTNGGSRVVSQR